MTNESALRHTTTDELVTANFPQIRVHRHTKFWLILAGAAASLATHHELGANHPVIHCVSESLLYAASIGVPLLSVMERCGLFIARQQWPWKWVYLLVAIVVPATFGTLVAGTILYVIGFHGQDQTGPFSWEELREALGFSLIFGISLHLYEGLREQLAATSLQLRTKQRDEERARKLALAAQLASLESRVQPHFLFNTLNSISALIRENPEQAERMVERLAALLRFSLDSHQYQTVPLRDEVKLVSDYLQIEKARFGPRLSYELAVPEELNAASVPPFTLQTLVENSIKHAVATNRKGGALAVKAFAETQTLHLSVSDDGPGFAGEAILAGHGLDNLQSRLAALYGAQGKLAIESTPQQTTVQVSLPLAQ